MNQIVEADTQVAAKRERLEVIDSVPLLDTSRFEHMQRVATVMARSTLMPETLYMEGTKNDKQMLPYEQILSNCFLVVNQAVRWGLDPFAVAQCVSVVHGKLCYEGKLVSAVLQAKMGINLHHVIVGEGEATRIYLSDMPVNDEVKALLKPGYRREDMRLFDGSVAEWKTTGNNSPWSPKNFSRMLIYRGTRDWCRIYEPALMLGVYTDDEMVGMEDTVRARSARNVTPSTIVDPFSDEPAAITAAVRQSEPVEFDTIDSDEPHDAETGELLDNSPSDAPSPSPSASDDESEPSPSLSQEPAGEPAPSAGSLEPEHVPIPETELPAIRKFARIAFRTAGTDNMAPETLTKVMNRAINVELANVSSVSGKAAVNLIRKNAKAVLNGDADFMAAVEHHAEGLGCEPDELIGDTDG